MTNDDEDYREILEAAQAGENAHWLLADAVLAKLPEGTPGLSQRVTEICAYLDSKGYDGYAPTGLLPKRKVALMFPPATRTKDASIFVHHEAMVAQERGVIRSRFDTMRAYANECALQRVSMTRPGIKRFMGIEEVKKDPAQAIVDQLDKSDPETQRKVTEKIMEREEKKVQEFHGSEPEKPVRFTVLAKVSTIGRELTQLESMITRGVRERMSDADIESTCRMLQELRRQAEVIESMFRDGAGLTDQDEQELQELLGKK